MVVVDTFSVEVLNDCGKWEEISAVSYKSYFEKPDKGFIITKDDENKLTNYKKTSETPKLRLTTLKYNKQTDVIHSFIVIEFQKWTIHDRRVIALADSVKKYSLSEKEYKMQVIR